MTPPRSIMSTIVRARLVSDNRTRRLLFLALIAVALLLAFFPERHRAAVTLTPADPQSLGLSGTLGQLGAINNVFGNQAAVEVALRVARSEQARALVIKRLKLGDRMHEQDAIKLHRWLEDEIEIRSLRGGIVLMEMQHGDARLARDIVAAFADATQTRLAEISRRQTAYKREVLVKLVDDASLQLSQAQARYDQFRLTNRTPSPRAAVEAVGFRLPQLEAEIKAKQVELAAARQLYTDDNIIVRQRSAELAALQRQLQSSRATNASDDSTVGRAVASSSKLFKLERDLTIARALYDSYLRYLQGTAVEDLTSTANIRVLEPPFVDTERQIYLPAAAAALALLMLWLAIEFYRLRPAVGDRVVVREQDV
jgi:tyrosine-protein kinase Etk/Wzc